MKQRKYLDFFASVGRPAVPGKDFPYDLDTMLKDMEYARIHGAAFMHSIAKDYSYTMGNREAIKLAGESSRIFPLAIVADTAAFETGNRNYYKDLLDNGVCGFVNFFSGPEDDTLKPDSFAKICSTLIEYNRPLIISGASNKNVYDNVDVLAQAFPELNIIMHGSHWGGNRRFFDVMERNANLHFEITSNHTNNIIEVAKANFGIDRVLYSSMWPYKSMGAIKMLVEYADISESDKDLIAHGNACRLFGISPDSLELYDDSACKLDEIAREADAGVPISVPVIDSHSHIVGNGEPVNASMMPGSDPKDMAVKMDRLGVDTTITAPWVGIAYSGFLGNAETLDANQKFPGKFLGFSTSNVNYEDEKKATLECHEKYPDVFVGIKPYPPYQKFRHTDEICREWYEYANEHHLIALIHTAIGDFAAQTDELASKYPNITFLMAHTGASFDVARENIAVAKKHDNVMLEITYTSTFRGMIEYLVKEVGAEKVIYGSDMPMRDPGPQLGWVCYADIPLEDKKKILAGNIKRILAKRK